MVESGLAASFLLTMKTSTKTAPSDTPATPFTHAVRDVRDLKRHFHDKGIFRCFGRWLLQRVSQATIEIERAAEKRSTICILTGVQLGAVACTEMGATSPRHVLPLSVIIGPCYKRKLIVIPRVSGLDLGYGYELRWVETSAVAYGRGE